MALGKAILTQSSQHKEYIHCTIVRVLESRVLVSERLRNVTANNKWGEHGHTFKVVNHLGVQSMEISDQKTNR